MSEIKEYWKRIEKWFKKNKPEFLEALAEGASEDEIVQLEKYLRCTLPTDFRESLKIHNGQKVSELLFHDGRDNFLLYSIKKIKEEFDYRNKNWQEIIDAYDETGEQFNAKSIPIYYFVTGDVTYMDNKDGKLLFVSHEADVYKIPDFKSVLKKMADYLESGRFFLNTNGLIGQLRLDETWQKINDLPQISKKLEKEMRMFGEDDKRFSDFFGRKFFGENFKEFSFFKLNEHFRRTFSSNHNGQKTREHLFSDGEDEFEFLSLSRIIDEYVEITDDYGKIIPLFKNNENGNTIFIDIYSKMYNSCKLFKYYKEKAMIQPIEHDLIDLLVITYNKNRK